MAEKRLEIEGLRQRLYDPARREQFVVYVERNVTLLSGDFVSLLGPSGCGKTTLLSILGLLRSPTNPVALGCFKIWAPCSSGSRTEQFDIRQAWIENNRGAIEAVRRRHIGFALQSGELISSLTVHENIAVPLRLNGISRPETTSRVHSLLDAFQLRRQLESTSIAIGDVDGVKDNSVSSERFTSLAHATINRLSGGEYQRVALARAIAHRPTIVFVDEPTSALNRELARKSLELLKHLQSARHDDCTAGVTVMITHDEHFAEEFSNVIIRMAPRKNEPAGEVMEVARLS
jgi:putative ABC transport system ATP-binding protein